MRPGELWVALRAALPFLLGGLVVLVLAAVGVVAVVGWLR